MKRYLAVLALLMMLAASLAAQNAPSRLLTGQVVDKSDAAVPNAVVYLKNTKTLAVKTFIANANGQYRFPALSLNVDYEVYAEHNGRKSDVKTLSSFDSRQSAQINLRLP